MLVYNLFVILCLEVFCAPLEFVEPPSLPKIVKGGNARKVYYCFFVEIPSKSFPGVAGDASLTGVAGVVAIPPSLNPFGNEEKGMNYKGGEHPYQSEGSPTRMVRMQIHKIGQVCYHIQRW